jgi:hypothetical protein
VHGVARLHLQEVRFSSYLVHSIRTLTLCEGSSEVHTSTFSMDDVLHVLHTGQVPARLRAWAKAKWEPLRVDLSELKEWSDAKEKANELSRRAWKNRGCWEAALQTEDVIEILEDVAVIMQVIAQVDADGDCSNCLLRNAVEVMFSCPCEDHHAIPLRSNTGLVRILQIGTGALRGPDIVMIPRGHGHASHICGNGPGCMKPDDIVFESWAKNLHRVVHHEMIYQKGQPAELVCVHGTCSPPCRNGGKRPEIARPALYLNLSSRDATINSVQRFLQQVLEEKEANRLSDKDVVYVGSEVEIMTDDDEDSGVKSNARGRNKITKAGQTSKKSSNR